MTGKRGFFLLVSILLLPFVLAQTSTQPESTTLNPNAGYDWLANASTTHILTVPDQAYAILALLSEPGKVQTVANLRQTLQTNEDATNACWPKQGCKTRASALSILALTKTGTATTSEITKLKSQRIATLRTEGEWRIQIDAPSDGTCTLTWGTDQRKKEFQLKNNTILGTSKKFYITINSDIPGATTLLATPNNKISVDCTQLSGTVTLSLIYAKTVNDLYIVQSFPNTAKTDMMIQNACLPDSYGGTSCNYDATLESTWALIEAGETPENLGTLPYLASSIGNDDTQRAYLARLLSTAGKTPTSFLAQLAANQKSDGSWKNRDIFTTSIAILALQPSSGSYQDAITNGKLFLQRSQSNDGSWKQTVRETAFALLALRGGFEDTTIRLPASQRIPGSQEICDNQVDDDKNGFVDCGDVDICGKEKICHCENLEKDFDEESTDCGGLDCRVCKGKEEPVISSEEPETTEPTARPGRCTLDTDCDPGQTCTNGICEEPTKTNTGLIIAVIIAALLILFGIIFYVRLVRTGKVDLKNIFSKKGKKQTFEEFKRMAEFKPVQETKPAQPSPKPGARPAPRATRAIEDEALERSLKEAEKLLHKK